MYTRYDHDPKPTTTTSTLAGGLCIRQQPKRVVRGLAKKWLHPTQAHILTREQAVLAERLEQERVGAPPRYCKDSELSKTS